MMLCKADFEEIFPELFEPNQRPLSETPVETSSPACIARWEDDGGRPNEMRCRDATAFHAAGDGGAVPDPMSTRFALAMMPVAAAYGAAWVMLASLDRMAKF